MTGDTFSHIFASRCTKFAHAHPPPHLCCDKSTTSRLYDMELYDVRDADEGTLLCACALRSSKTLCRDTNTHTSVLTCGGGGGAKCTCHDAVFLLLSSLVCDASITEQ